MYTCQVCTRPSAPNAKQLKIIIRRTRSKDDPLNNSIEREIPACQLCVEGHAKGIPLAALAKMHRPVSPPPQRTGLGGAAPMPAADLRRPPDGAAHKLAFGSLPPAHPGEPGPISPSHLPPKNSRQHAKVDTLLANLEEGGKRKPARKPLKHLIKRGRNADHSPPSSKAPHKQAGAKVP